MDSLNKPKVELKWHPTNSTENRKRKGTENRWGKYKTNSNTADLNPTRFKSNLNTDNYIKCKALIVVGVSVASKPARLLCP